MGFVDQVRWLATARANIADPDFESRNGSRIALGSDFPVESVDPMKGIYAAVYREGW